MNDLTAKLVGWTFILTPLLIWCVLIKSFLPILVPAGMAAVAIGIIIVTE